MRTVLAIRIAALLAALVCVAATACGGDGTPSPDGTPAARPIPSPVTVRQEPEGVTLGDPAFQALPGARADFGRLGGAVYQIEMPNNWSGRLLLFMHGYGELRPEANVSPPGIRTYLIAHGYAWGASSFSSTSSIPGRSADETAALWDFFTEKYGRPAWTYVTGQSMGGAASHIAAERYPDRFDGALGLCGSAGQTFGAQQQADFFAAAAYVAGATQAEFDATTDAVKLINERILPALEDPAVHERWEDIMIDSPAARAPSIAKASTAKKGPTGNAPRSSSPRTWRRTLTQRINSAPSALSRATSSTARSYVCLRTKS